MTSAPATSLADTKVQPPKPAGDALARHRGVVIGQILQCDSDGRIWLNLPTHPGQPACAQFALCDPAELKPGCRVAVLFQEERSAFPVVVGPIVAETPALPANDLPRPARLSFEADREIVLRCGKSSIQLMADGSVLIRGAYVLSRASGTNRIRGGNVQIN